MTYRFKHGDRPLDDYTIQRAVGNGGFGEVYYSVSDGGREVALKYLRQNPKAELRGVSHCINLKSPHLVSIFDVKKNTDGEYFIIMEYCSGPSLRDLLNAEPGGFAPEKAAFFVCEIAKGLSYLHERGIVHRDLKPANLFYDDGYVKIGDYRLSKFISAFHHSAQTASVGTVHYMAPEIGSGDYSRSVDIYALGVILYEMLLGKVPFDGSTMAEILMKHLTAQPEMELLPEPFGRVILRALEKDPEDRYQTVREVLDDLLADGEVRKSMAGFSPKNSQESVTTDIGLGLLRKALSNAVSLAAEGSRMPETYLTGRQLAEFKTLLITKRRELIAEVDDLAKQVDDLAKQRDNWEQEFTLGLIENIRARIPAIDDALERIEAKSYGICQATHKTISIARLRAKPWARYCIEYARIVEGLGDP